MKSKLKKLAPIILCIILGFMLAVLSKTGMFDNLSIPDDNSIPSLSPHGAMSGTIG